MQKGISVSCGNIDELTWPSPELDDMYALWEIAKLWSGMNFTSD
jgi:hypothetical protein